MTKLNKRLAMVLAGLVALYVLTIVFHAAGRESTIQAMTFHTDTSGITEIDLYPYRAGRQEIKLVRQAGRWRVRSGTVDAVPMAGSAESLLSMLANVPTQRLISRRKDKWDEYRVGDTTGSRVVFYRGGNPVADYFIGEGGSGPGGGSGEGGSGSGLYGGAGAGMSYIRQNGHDEVYAVDNYLNGMVDRTIADWRDRSFLRLYPGAITGISFQGAGGYALAKKDTSWWLRGVHVSKDSVDRYLGRLESYDPGKFADDFTANGSPDRSILFSDTTAPVATVRAWRRPDGSWVVNSSQNLDGYFSVSDSVMSSALWKGPGSWVK